MLKQILSIQKSFFFRHFQQLISLSDEYNFRLQKIILDSYEYAE